MADDGAAALLVDADVIVDDGDELPDRGEFLARIGAGEGRASALLRVLLGRCRAGAPIAEQLATVVDLGRFVVAGPAVPNVTGEQPAARLELLVVALENIPAAQRRFRATIHAVLTATRAVKLFGEIGLPNDRGLLAETSDRLARAVLPEPPAVNEMWRLASHIFREPKDLEWLGPAADPLLNRLAAVGGEAWAPLQVQVLDAISVITTRIAALGMSEAMRVRMIETTVRDSPLYLLTRSDPGTMSLLIESAREQLAMLHGALEEHGVSVDVVYRIDAIERGLARLELLLPFAESTPRLQTSSDIRALVTDVGNGLVANRSFTRMLADNMRLLARKVIERAGRSGEHYVTASRREYWKMLGSAFGGGVVTLGTVCAKFLVKWGQWPLFLDGLWSSLVYAGSFVLMQLVGLTLATKQPSITAAALAGTIRDQTGPGRLDELVRLIARIARSQFAAAVGNVIGVIVTSLAFDTLWRNLAGHSFLDDHTAGAVVRSFHPFKSGTIFFAAVTGVLLWMSSLAAGWFENWIVYRRVPEAIEHHRFGKQVGPERMVKVARFIEREAAGFGGSVSLGFLLGMTPVFAKFFGLPLDVRHITLSTGSLTMSIQALGIDAVGWEALIWAAVGIVIIGLLNFGVSFGLALIVALRARDVPRGERRMLPGAVLRRFVRKPFEFFFPPKDGTNPTWQSNDSTRS